MESWSIEPQTGGEPKPGDVVGRDDAIVNMLASLARGNSLLLVDPRRMGKTSLLMRLCNEPGPGVYAVNLSLEGAASSGEVFDRTVKAMLEHASLATKAKKALGALVEFEAKGGPVRVKATFQNRAKADLLVDVVAAVEAKLDDNEILVVALDEVPLAVRNITKAEGPEASEVLLQRLRSMRQTSTKVRWVIAGSIGFHHVLRSANTSEGVIGDLEPVLLGPLDTTNAALLTRCLMTGIGRETADEAVDHIVYLSGAIPFLIHHIAHQLNQTSQTPVTIAAADTAWAMFLDRDRSKAMTHLVTRLDEYPDNLRKPARALLDHTATATDPISYEEIRAVAASANLDADDILMMVDYLVDDHYLAEHDARFAWRYDVLRRIWIHRRKLNAQ